MDGSVVCFCLNIFLIMEFPFDLFSCLVVITILDIFKKWYCKGVKFTVI